MFHMDQWHDCTKVRLTTNVTTQFGLETTMSAGGVFLLARFTTPNVSAVAVMEVVKDLRVTDNCKACNWALSGLFHTSCIVLLPSV